MLICLLPHLVLTSFPFLSYLLPLRFNSFSQPETDTSTQLIANICAFSPLCLSSRARTSPVTGGGEGTDPALGTLVFFTRIYKLLTPGALFGSSHPPQNSFLYISMGGRAGADLGMEHSPRMSIVFPLPHPLICPQHPMKCRPSSEESKLSAALPRNCHTSHQSDCSLFEHFLLFD